MSASPRQMVLADLETALAIGAPAGTHVHRHPMRPIEKDKLPALCLYALSFRSEGKATGLRPYNMPVRIEVRGVGKCPDQDLDALICHVQRVVLGSPCFSNRVQGVEEGEAQYDAIAADKVYLAAALDYNIAYLHDPTQQGEEPFEPAPGPALTEIS